ncbi:MAG: chorismate mutase [Alphaproteobacteria bacterium]|nr:chorismate mutase [Alphaproteobacteria bacterium]
MPKTPTLAQLRGRIDSIDSKLHDLLMKRALVVESVGKLKHAAGGGPPFRLGREAEILRRLASRHQGPLPFGVIARLWREIIASFTQLELAYAVALCLPSPDSPVKDLARDHYGGGVTLLPFAQPGAALAALTEGKALQAVLPWPRPDEEAPWWPLLMDGGQPPRIVARLPFVGQPQPGREALVVARFAPEPSGDDLTLIGLETREPASRSSLKSEFEKAGFTVRPIFAGPVRGKPLALIELDGYVEASDERLDKMALPRLQVLGAYARPITD